MWLGIFAAYLLLCLNIFSAGLKKVQFTGFAQGATYQITYYATDSSIRQWQIDSILNNIDSSLSLYKPYSLINQFNSSEKGIEIDHHFKTVFDKSLEVYQTTSGLFDITVKPLVEAWGFGVKKIEVMPSDAIVADLRKCVGSDILERRGDSLLKKKSCVQIDMNGIAQGYSVDVLADFLETYGVSNYVVELGGELRVSGKNASGEKMKIGIESPPKNEFEAETFENILSIDKGAITTSGSYRKYYESNGKRITHLIDPLSGYPIQNELISVTVYAKDAITADAYDNALMLMGLNKALSFVENRNDIEAYFIYKKSDGTIADTASRGFYTMLNH
ncbi:MAG: FAD:protein FMN transferase [Flavisolibacter sp.]|nr:FAD:protein FMN transferase [Flavisolibacter sp.]